MAKKLSNKFVALASVAVGVVYAAGYVVTDSAPQALAHATGAVSALASAGNTSGTSSSSSGETGNSGQGYGHHHHRHDGGDDGGYGQSGSGTASSGTASSGTSESSPATSSTQSSSGSSASSSSSSSSSSGASGASKSTSSKSTQKYLDGTYSGSGSNRIGTIQVSVTLKNDKITNVQITGCYTHYPEDYINPVLPQQVLSQQNTNISYISGATLSSMDFQDAVNQALQQAQNPNYHGA